jgi:hypothetical protein
MFISSDYLSINYGVDDTIARFFVDREPPTDNLYWHEKLLYLRPTVGYLFIPLIVDLLHKLGIERQQLLSEAFVSVMERVGHISALEETKQISAAEAVDRCLALVETSNINKEWFRKLKEYFENKEGNDFKKHASPFKALHRGDVFLFSLTVLDFPTGLLENVVKNWFALITTLLLLDDAEDLKKDKEEGEENALLEGGLDVNGIQQIKELVHNNLSVLKKVNPSLSQMLLNQYKEKVELPIINKLIKGS